MGEYQAGEGHVRFWLEWDRATMGTRDLFAKFQTYTQYVTSHAWFKEQRELPYLLVIVPGKEQEMRIARIARALLVDTPDLSYRPPPLRDWQMWGHSLRSGTKHLRRVREQKWYRE